MNVKGQHIQRSNNGECELLPRCSASKDIMSPEGHHHQRCPHQEPRSPALQGDFSPQARTTWTSRQLAPQSMTGLTWQETESP